MAGVGRAGGAECWRCLIIYKSLACLLSSNDLGRKVLVTSVEYSKMQCFTRQCFANRLPSLEAVSVQLLIVFRPSSFISRKHLNGCFELLMLFSKALLSLLDLLPSLHDGLDFFSIICGRFRRVGAFSQ